MPQSANSRGVIDHAQLNGFANFIDNQLPRGISFMLVLFPSDGDGESVANGNGPYRATVNALHATAKKVQDEHVVVIR